MPCAGDAAGEEAGGPCCGCALAPNMLLAGGGAGAGSAFAPDVDGWVAIVTAARAALPAHGHCRAARGSSQMQKGMDTHRVRRVWIHDRAGLIPFNKPLTTVRRA